MAIFRNFSKKCIENPSNLKDLSINSDQFFGIKIMQVLFRAIKSSLNLENLKLKSLKNFSSETNQKQSKKYFEYALKSIKKLKKLKKIEIVGANFNFIKNLNTLKYTRNVGTSQDFITIKNIINCFPRVENLELDLSQTKYARDFEFNEIMISVSNLKYLQSLNIDLRKTDLPKCFYSALENISSIKNLKDLSLEISDSLTASINIFNALERIPFIQKLKLLLFNANNLGIDLKMI